MYFGISLLFLDFCSSNCVIIYKLRRLAEYTPALRVIKSYPNNLIDLLHNSDYYIDNLIFYPI